MRFPVCSIAYEYCLIFVPDEHTLNSSKTEYKVDTTSFIDDIELLLEILSKPLANGVFMLLLVHYKS